MLASGAGSNLQAILDTLHGGPEGIVVAAVASDKPGAPALERAQQAGVPTATFPLADYPDRAARDAALADWVAGHDVRLVVLAGYMAAADARVPAALPARGRSTCTRRCCPPSPASTRSGRRSRTG